MDFTLAFAVRYRYAVAQFINEQAVLAEGSLPAIDDLEAVIRAERHRIHHYDDETFRNVADS